MKVVYSRGRGRPAVFRKNDFCRLKIVNFVLAKDTATCNFTIYTILQAEIILLHSCMPDILPAVLRKINFCRPYHEVSPINFTLTSLQNWRNRNITGFIYTIKPAFTRIPACKIHEFEILQANRYKIKEIQ